MSTSWLNSNMSNEYNTSTTSSSSLTPQSAKYMLNNIRNLNDVFEFAKNDESNKYLTDSISRNFSNKRMKLKELMDEVVVLQNESNKSEIKELSFDQIKSTQESQPNKKTLVSILSSPSNQKQFNLPALNHSDLIQTNSISDKALKPISSRDHLKDIFELIKLNNQSIETSSNRFIEYKPDESFEDSNEHIRRKSFINKLDEKEQMLSNNINRNMKLLQNCLKANLEYNKSQENSRKYPLRVIKVSDSSPKTSSLDNSTLNDQTKIIKKLNFYSIGNFDSVSTLNKLEEETNTRRCNDYTNSLDQMNELLILNEENNSISNTKISTKHKYVCQVCGVRAKKPSILKLHIKSHADMRTYKCTWCNISFKTKGNLTKHVKTQGHFRKCLELGFNANDEEITKISNNDLIALDEQSSNNVSIFNE